MDRTISNFALLLIVFPCRLSSINLQYYSAVGMGGGEGEGGSDQLNPPPNHDRLMRKIYGKNILEVYVIHLLLCSFNTFSYLLFCRLQYKKKHSVYIVHAS